MAPEASPLQPGERVENIQSYRKGGLHPIQIGDKLKNKRYEVIHKLGKGYFSTVWLARDEQKCVAVKVHSVEGSRRTQEIAIHRRLAKDETGYTAAAIAKLLDHFNVRGPNGLHTCLVLDLHGPCLDDLCNYETKIRPDVSRELSRQIASGIAFLHKHNVAFGDLSPDNILVKTKDLAHMATDALYAILGHPQPQPVAHRVSDKRVPHVPEFVYPSIDFSRLDLKTLLPQAILTDLNEAALTDDLEGHYPSGIHLHYASPEFVFGIHRTHTKASDVWALACTLYKIRSSTLLMPSISISGYAANLQHLIGPIPPNLREKMTEEARTEIRFLTDDDLQKSKMTLRHRLGAIGVWKPWHTMTREERREYIISWGRKTFEETGSNPCEEPDFDLDYRLDTGSPPSAKMSQAEFADFHNLLMNMLKCDAANRYSIGAVLAHPWLNDKYQYLDDHEEHWVAKFDQGQTEYLTASQEKGKDKAKLNDIFDPPPGWEEEEDAFDVGDPDGLMFDLEGEAFWDAKESQEARLRAGYGLLGMMSNVALATAIEVMEDEDFSVTKLLGLAP